MDIDAKAKTTIGNAEETTKWVKKNKIKSVILVTAGYHMPRSKLLLERACPDLLVIPASRQILQYKEWWKTPKGIRVILEEYVKYLLTFLHITS